MVTGKGRRWTHFGPVTVGKRVPQIPGVTHAHFRLPDPLFITDVRRRLRAALQIFRVQFRLF
jgi:hypothetical protein